MREKITLERCLCAGPLLPQINWDEADEEFRQAAEASRDLWTVRRDGVPIGVALATEGREAFLYLYMFPPCREYGWGAQALALLEQKLRSSGAEKIETCWRSGDDRSRHFSEKWGYQRKFSSDYMVYTGPVPAPEMLCVREYRDEDFPRAHKLCAEAFHRMRLGTGCFPDSVPEQPDGETQRAWAETAKERVVCLEGGEIVGYAHVEGGTIDALAVAPEQQGRGVGRRLLKYLINRLHSEGNEKISLYCVVGNPARRLYDRLGFHTAYTNDYGEKKFQ